jgi:hypothetical protein
VRRRLLSARPLPLFPFPSPSPPHPLPRTQELTLLTERLGRLNEDLTRKLTARNEYDAVIGETEAAYMKVRRRAGGGGAAHRDGAHRPNLCTSSRFYYRFIALPAPPPPPPDSQILESSQTLLSVLKREAVSLSKRTAGPL